MNGVGFQRFGIDHLSASSINLWIAAPSAWVARYVLKRPLPFGPAAARGKAVEAAVVAALMGEAEDAAIRAAETGFDRDFMIGTAETTVERDLIAPMVKVALNELRPYGCPDFPEGVTQEKVVLNANFGEWSIPIWGFLDLRFDAHGVVVDLKSTTRVPSSMTAAHCLQRAIYQRACGNAAVRFLYVSAKKAAWLEDGDTAECLTAAKRTIARMDAFLAACPDAGTAQRIVPHDGTSFYWRGAEALAAELYG